MPYWVIEPPPKSLDLSVVIPVKDEVGNVAELAAEISAGLEPTPYSWEAVWVDDGSTDGTADVLRRLHSGDPRHRVVTLPRNLGQSAALAVGFSAARGALLATLDGDGQNDPADVPRLVAMLRETGADVVNGWRETRRDGVVRKIASRVGNGFRNWATGERIRDVGCSMRVLRREVVRHLFVFRGMHRFLPTLARLNGAAHMVEVPVNHRPRLRGKTKYGINNRLWVGFADALAVRWLTWRAAGAPPRELLREETPALRRAEETPAVRRAGVAS